MTVAGDFWFRAFEEPDDPNRLEYRFVMPHVALSGDCGIIWDRDVKQWRITPGGRRAFLGGHRGRPSDRGPGADSSPMG